MNIICDRIKSMALQRLLLLVAMVIGQWSLVNGQITIGGNVFGGGREADVSGDAAVEIHGSSASTGMITISGVYGGNDVSGTVVGGSSVHTDGGIYLFVGQLFGGGNGDYTYTLITDSSDPNYGKYRVTQLVWNTMTHVWEDVEVAITDTDDAPIISTAAINLEAGTFGYVFGGGNAANVTTETDITINIPAENTPLDINQGDDDSDGDENNDDDDLITNDDLLAMGLNTAYFDRSGAFNISRLFGGNNKVAMHIRPTWNLHKGKIESLYSGGNRGDMTSPEGLLLDIDPIVTGQNLTYAEKEAEKKQLKIEYVYGGCRMANVIPQDESGHEMTVQPPTGTDSQGNAYHFPPELSARVLVRGGDIKTVYGGNDVTGRVAGGSAIGIYTTIRGDVYGGGNGRYPYTDGGDGSAADRQTLYNSQHWGDFYYGDPDNPFADNAASIAALNAFRPNAEQVSIRLKGTDADHPTIIHGSVYLGGNCATLKTTKVETQPMVELKIGSYVIADNVFLGNNGEDMVNTEMLTQYKYGVVDANVSSDTGATGYVDYSTLDLTDPTTFEAYMDGTTMTLMPSVLCDGDADTDVDQYEDYTSYLGSLFCGGNVGSMKVPGKTTMNFRHNFIVYEKVVGGSNNAFVPVKYLNDDPTAAALNASFNGGILAAPETGTENKLELNFNGLKIQPKRWARASYPDGEYLTTNTGSHYLIWNTVSAATGLNVDPVTTTNLDPGLTYESSDADDLDRRLKGGNIYGGCYNSGIVNGNVVINLNTTLVDRQGDFAIFDKINQNEGEALLYATDEYQITERRSGVLLDKQGMDVLGKALNVFGGGYGKDSEIWGSTTINLNAGYTFQIFGGGEHGVIGKPDDPGNTGTITQCTFNGRTYKYNPKYSCTINVKGTVKGVYRGHTDDSPDMAEAEFIYGGAFFSPVCGNTTINLGNGRIFNSFAGSCNGDILGHTETYVGRNISSDALSDRGFPWIRDHIYGGNDLGGRIMNSENFQSRVQAVNASDVLGMMYNPKDKQTLDVTDASSYIEFIQGRTDYIFGGCYGVYDYTNTHYKEYTYTCTKNEATGVITYTDDGSNVNNVGKAKPGFIMPRLNNAFINFRPIDNSESMVNRIYGAGQGHTLCADRDVMQNRSYVLIDIPENKAYFQNMVVFGAGDFCGLGMQSDTYTADNGFTTALGYDSTRDNGISYDDAKANADGVTAASVIDLIHGQIRNVYGGSYNEGITRRSIVNVPAAPTGSAANAKGSTIQINNIFGGAYGENTFLPCDVYEANVNYGSADAKMSGYIYGGNNNERRTLYSKVNIYSEVVSTNANHNYLGTIYGAGHGSNTWTQYTEVNLEENAKIYEVYGGGEAGKVHNAESEQQFMNVYKPANWPKANASDPDVPFTATDWLNAWKLGPGYDSQNFASTFATGYATYDEYTHNTKTNLENPLVRLAEMDDRFNPDHEKYAYGNYSTGHRGAVEYRYNANVLIKEGATVTNYAYGGGLGADAVVAGTTYIALLGGTVNKDIYAAGTSGAVQDLHNAGNFVASANAYIRGGVVRNVFGGGWRGSVGYAQFLEGDPILYNGEQVLDDNQEPVRYQIPDFGTDWANDILGESHVVIGTNAADGTFLNGIPSITRNVYGGGEGGAIFGTAYVTVYNGYIGYRYNPDGTDDGTTDDFDEKYEPEVDDKPGDGQLEAYGGNVFGGGYVANSTVDFTDVNFYKGNIRGGLYGGGEIGPIGRGTVSTSVPGPAQGSTCPKFINGVAKIYRDGETHVDMYGGHVFQDVFGGGRGYDNWKQNGWMTDIEKKTMDLSSKGFVFGSTEVHVHGGEVGTAENALKGHGNVFAGGNEGFVYSGKGTKIGTNHDDQNLEKGMPEDGGGFYYSTWDASDMNNSVLSVDCTVDITPFCLVTDPNGITIPNDQSYAQGEYVKVEALNKLRNRKAAAADWGKLNIDGIVIHNAVFAGGNITSGSDIISASTPTVYGNAGASLRDVYNIDLITIGTDDVGGIYGDGNLTLVDGFREIHIDNYGTDKYSLDDTMPLDDTGYYSLTERQKAYYQLKYITKTNYQSNHVYTYYESQRNHTYNEVTYKRGQKITPATWGTFSLEEKENWQYGIKTFEPDEQIEEGEWLLMDKDEQDKWVLYGVCSIYAGRPLNTIQRADMCGVFGSRMVLKGAPDRVPNVITDDNYTINRVDEVSLNQRVSTASGDENDDVNAVHGNYFGIYNSVHFLGNLTSDVLFASPRQSTAGGSLAPDGTATYHDWKFEYRTTPDRNNGSSHNKVALASGVYLEIKREEGEATGTDDWGYITGVVELDLINVMPGMGGGYVYARNVHGTKTWHGEGNTDGVEVWSKVTMLEYNEEARTYRHFEYTPSPGSDLEYIESSGNFVHPTKQIVDDCYPNGGIYNEGYVESPAHYWFIKGSIYVYEQEITAYTGTANAYAKKVELPLTISAASHGKLTLREVQPNYYAYYDKNGNKLGDPDPDKHADDFFTANNITYHLNDPISYWQFSLLDEGDKAKFVPKTYVVIEDCKVNGDSYTSGTVMLAEDYNDLQGATVTYTDINGVEQNDKPLSYFIRESNNMSHYTGYILTYNMNNPGVWDNYYTAVTGNSKLSTADYNEQSGYLKSPTYTPLTAGIYGQHNVEAGQIINGNIVNAYNAMLAQGHSPTDDPNTTEDDPAIVQRAYIAISEVQYTYNGNEKNINPGAPISAEEYGGISSTAQSAFEPASVCIKVLEFSANDYVFTGKLLSPADVDELRTKVIAMNNYVSDAQGTASAKADEFLSEYIADAYLCTKEGLYGGSYYTVGTNYRPLETFCDMIKSERDQFAFNYDALDLLIDPTYSGGYGNKPQYDGYNPADETQSLYPGWPKLDPKIYSVSQPIDYQAEYIGNTQSEIDGNGHRYFTYIDETGTTQTVTASTNADDWLRREEYEDIPNEKRFYTPIIVTNPGNYYVVKTPFMRGEVPYTSGQVIEEDIYNSLTAQQKENIDIYSFTTAHCHQKKDDQGQDVVDGEGHPVWDEVYYFYCRESYTINEHGEGQAVTTVAITKNASTNLTSETYDPVEYPNEPDEDNIVPQGVIIDKNGYDALKNFQTNFIVHGTAPTETSTLYVSSESDIKDVSTEKIITVIYLYEYEESDASGLNVNPVSERHIVNIHIKFKTGAPTVGKLEEPDIVLPGTSIGMEIPTVVEGAARVTTSGWEIYSNEGDAVTHTNGKEYKNNQTPVYWYQNNYWIAYYAESQLGRTYSNSVHFKVANYHDLKKVMDDKAHHYYIDHKDIDYEPKIYINSYNDQNGLDLFKNLIDLTYVEKTVDQTTGETLPISGGALDGHMPLDINLVHINPDIPNDPGKTVKGGDYFEFILRTDIDHTETSGSPAWQPIANGTGECFSGNFHGDGHTISGLTNSLFGHLCGNVYNLGVTGPFTSAGIAETGGGFVENCWIMSTATSGFSANTNPVFNTPDDDQKTHVVNCYYPEPPLVSSNAGLVSLTPYYKDDGPATRMPEQAFYNGTVAYDLNGFYLYKRYCDNVSNSALGSTVDYQYLNPGITDSQTGKPIPQTGYYGSNITYCSSGCGVYTENYEGYVEERFRDGDFRYEGESIPKIADYRLYTYTEQDSNGNDVEKYKYLPIWPDDYMFFGQMLTYGFSDEEPHQDVPSAIVKNNGRLINTIKSNRVYRAPAYYRNSIMDVAHFNQWANIAAYSKPKSITDTDLTPAYPDMTAIDFAGHNEKPFTLGFVSDGFPVGKPGFYPPLLDDDGLQSIAVNGEAPYRETANLLVYAPAASGSNGGYYNLDTYNVLTNYFTDPAYNSYYINDNYRRVNIMPSTLVGHLVQSDLTATNDHFLVDKQDFNCPIRYQFDSSHRMWYQRKPDTYVDLTKGWEGISIPFTAELVTTNEKGEITHFYSGSYDSYNMDEPETSTTDTNTKVGHEYWLRELFTGGNISTEDNKIYVANMSYPEAVTGNDKTVKNTFLWDYYYYETTAPHHQDKNKDPYQTYYMMKDVDNDGNEDYVNKFVGYPFLAASKPYIIGFPGPLYYEFDLSGVFAPTTTSLETHPAKLLAQTISFVSETGVWVEVSDGQMTGSIDNNSYNFKPNYLNKPDAVDNYTAYLLNADGNSYQVVTTTDNTLAVLPFRPYFIKQKPQQNQGNSPAPQYIAFSNEISQLHGKEVVPDIDENLTENVKIYPKRSKIVVESELREEATVQIYSSGGALVDTYNIKPGEIIETPIYNAGVYIVRAADGRYTKKVAVK